VKGLVIILLCLGATVYGEDGKRERREGEESIIDLSRSSNVVEIVVEPKSHRKALAMSALLPGLGEYYMGGKSDAIRACLIEVGIWSTFFGARWYAGLMANDCETYAHANAGATVGWEDEEYYKAVEWKENLEAYNTSVREDARWIYQNDPDSLAKRMDYYKKHSFAESLAWEWKDEARWDKYRSLRSRGREILRNTTYCVGAAILNRVVSAVIATHLPVSGLGLHVKPNGMEIRYAIR
jgi:hypothetical protein